MVSNCALPQDADTSTPQLFSFLSTCPQDDLWHSLFHVDYSMVSKCGHPRLSPTQLFSFLSPLSMEDLCYLSVMMIILWSLGVGILQEADTSTPSSSPSCQPDHRMTFGILSVMMIILRTLHCKKKICHFPVPSRNAIDQTHPGRE
jgi:hypothetical protein